MRSNLNAPVPSCFVFFWWVFPFFLGFFCADVIEVQNLRAWLNAMDPSVKSMLSERKHPCFPKHDLSQFVFFYAKKTLNSQFVADLLLWYMCNCATFQFYRFASWVQRKRWFLLWNFQASRNGRSERGGYAGCRLISLAGERIIDYNQNGDPIEHHLVIK